MRDTGSLPSISVARKVRLIFGFVDQQSHLLSAAKRVTDDLDLERRIFERRQAIFGPATQQQFHEFSSVWSQVDVGALREGLHHQNLYQAR
jgi:hypothetical protein